MLDAFSSDTVPVHLLTVESFATSMRTLAPRGVIAVHISNRFIDLEPVVAAAARDLGFVAIIGSDLPPPELSDLADASQWVVVGRSFADVAGPRRGRSMADRARRRPARVDGSVQRPAGRAAGLTVDRPSTTALSSGDLQSA